MYKKYIPYLSGIFSKLCSNSLWFQSIPLSKYPYTLGFHGRKNWGQLIALPTFKNSFAHFLALNLRKKKLFYFSVEAYIVHLAKGIRIFGQGFLVKHIANGT
jgi:hypothetical protein